MKAIIIAALAALGFAVACAFVSWCCGFNFDHRNPDVGYVVMMTCWLSIIVGVVCYIWAKEDSEK